MVAIAIYQAGAVGPFGFAVLRAWDKLAGGAVAVAVFMLAMSKCSRDIASSQFTAAQVLYMSGGALAGLTSPALASVVGISAGDVLRRAARRSRSAWGAGAGARAHRRERYSGPSFR